MVCPALVCRRLGMAPLSKSDSVALLGQMRQQSSATRGMRGQGRGLEEAMPRRAGAAAGRCRHPLWVTRRVASNSFHQQAEAGMLGGRQEPVSALR